MILWNAFYTYFIRAGSNPKPIALGILAGFFLLQKFRIIEKCWSLFSKISSKKWFLLILVLGVGLRLAWGLWTPYSPPAAGTEDYVMLRHAHDLANGKGYITAEGIPTAGRPVGYALLLAGIFKIFGDNLGWIALMNILLIPVTLWLVYRLGVAIKNEFVGLAAAFILAIYPTSIFSIRIVLEEHVFIPMWLAGMLLLISDYQKPSWGKVLWATLLFAFGAHFRTFSFAMGLVAFFMWFLLKKNFTQAVLRLLVMQALIIMVALPWALRNNQKMGEPILYTTWMEGMLYYSNNPTSDVRYPVNPTLAQGGDVAFLTAKTELERSHASKNAALRWIVHNPGTFFQKAMGRAIYMLGLTREGWIVKDNFNSVRAGRVRPPEKLIGKLDKIDNDFYGVIFLLALFGMIVFFLPKQRSLRKRGMGYLLISLVYYLSMIAITIGHRKYRFPIEPIFCILAAYGISFFITPPKNPRNNGREADPIALK